MATKKRSSAEWNELKQRYFDCLTTEAEEAELKEYLRQQAGSIGTDKEVLAVVSYLETQRHFAQPKPRVITLAKRITAAAAVVAAAVSIIAAANQRDAYVVINGEKTYSQELATEQMLSDLGFLSSDAPSVENELMQAFAGM